LLNAKGYFSKASDKVVPDSTSLEILLIITFEEYMRILAPQ